MSIVRLILRVKSAKTYLFSPDILPKYKDYVTFFWTTAWIIDDRDGKFHRIQRLNHFRPDRHGDFLCPDKLGGRRHGGYPFYL